MAKSAKWNNCSPTAADLALMLQESGKHYEEYVWTVKNEGQSIFFIQHTLGTRYVAVHVYDMQSGAEIYPSIHIADEGQVNVGFTHPPAVGKMFMIIVCVG